MSLLLRKLWRHHARVLATALALASGGAGQAMAHPEGASNTPPVLRFDRTAVHGEATLEGTTIFTPENTPTTATIAAFTATDANGDMLTFEIGGTGHDYFNLSTDGILTFKAPQRFLRVFSAVIGSGRGRQSNNFSVAVTARDDHGATSNTVRLVIRLDDVDDPPIISVLPPLNRPPVAGEQLFFNLVDSDVNANTYATQWSHSDDGITFTDFDNPAGASYTLGASARGSYRVTATYNEYNRRGLRNSHETLVYVHTWAAVGGPGLPRNLHAFPDDSQVVLSWDPPARSADDSRDDPGITDYVITFQLETFLPVTFNDGVGSGTIVTVKTPGSTSPTTGIFNTLSYTFTVAARTAAGLGQALSIMATPNPITISVPGTLTLGEGGSASLTVSTSAATRAGITVAYTVAAGTAEAADYEVTGTRVTIPMGQTMIGIPIRAVQDSLFEEAESFTIRLGSVTSATSDVERSSSAFTTTVTIAEDVDDAISVSLAGDEAVLEGETATWTVNLTGGTATADVVVPYAITGTAIGGTDYTAPGGSSVTIASGQSNGMIAIATTDDGPGDSGETLIVTLGVPTGGGGPAGSLTVDGAAGTVTTTLLDGVCVRTEQVRNWIVAQVSGADNCGLVTDEHLAAISGAMSLTNQGITALKSGDFQGLTLSDLTLMNNQLTTLPAGVFDGLTLSGGLNLEGNPGAPFALTVELERAAGTGEVRLALAEGIPRALTVPITVVKGTPSPNQASFAAGATTSGAFTVTRSGPGITIVSIGTLPALPANYDGLQLNSGASLVLFADLYFTEGTRTLADAKLLYYALLPGLDDAARMTVLASVASGLSDELPKMLMAVSALVRENSGLLDFNADNAVNNQDAALFYYALALPVALGDGTPNSGFAAIREAILGPFMPPGKDSGQSLQDILRTINGL